MLLDLFRCFIDPLALMVLKLGRSNAMEPEAVVKAEDFGDANGELDHESPGQAHGAPGDGVVQENMEELEVEQDAFTRKVESFCKEQKLDFKNPKFYGEDVDLLKLWREVTKFGGYDAVCEKKLWKQVGKRFDPPKTCTSLSFTFRQFYAKALLEYERCHLRVFQTTEVVNSLPSPQQSACAAAAEVAPGTKRTRKDSKVSSDHESKRLRSGLHRSTNSNRLKPFNNALGQRDGDTSPSVTSSDTRTIDSDHEAQDDFASSDADHEVEPQDNIDEESADRSLMELDRTLSWSSRKLRPKSDPSANGQKHHSGGAENRSGCPIAPRAKGWSCRREDCEVSIGPFPLEKLKNVADDSDPGPAQWVKINAYKTRDEFQIYALVPGLAPSELRVECEVSGRVVIIGAPSQRRNLWGLTDFRKVILLPAKIDTRKFQASVSLYGQLLLRVPLLRENNQSNEEQKNA